VSEVGKYTPLLAQLGLTYTQYITLSFLFYIPMVLFADAVPLLGMLMIPKTRAYVWIVLMGFLDARRPKAKFCL
jgi:hypothetical protein